MKTFSERLISMFFRCVAFAILFFMLAVARLGRALPDPPDDRAIGLLESSRLLSQRDFGDLFETVRDWKRQKASVQASIVTCLSENLHSPKALELENFADLHINSRVASGKMECFGHGWFIDQDVFTERGRAAWAIEHLLDVRLPAFTADMSREELDFAIRETRRIVENAAKNIAG